MVEESIRLMKIFFKDELVGMAESTINKKLWDEWKIKRRKTFIGYIIVGIIVGIDYSVVFSTLYLYLSETLKTENDPLYYGLIIAAYAISSTIFGMIFGRWVDKTRNIKLFTNIVIALQIIGSLLYVIPFHVAFPLIGRFIAGSGDPFSNICTGEIIRIYDEKESTRALWWLASCYSIGLVIGPVIPLTFGGIEFAIGSLKFNQYNFIGLFMAGILILSAIVVNFLIYDCSKEIDLKTYLKDHDTPVDDGDVEEIKKKSSIGVENKFYEKTDTNGVCNTTSGNIDDKTNIGNTSQTDLDVPELTTPEVAIKEFKVPTVSLTFKKLMTSIDVTLLFISSFICMYSMFAVDVLVPLVMLVMLEWKQAALATFLVLSGVVYALMLLIMSKISNSNNSLYNTLIICLLGQILMFLMIIVIKLKTRHFAIDIILITFLGVFWLLTSCIEEVIIKAILAKKVPSSVQSFTESIRNGISSVSTIIAALSTPLVLPVVEWWALALMVVAGMLLIAFTLRRRSLIRAKEIQFVEE